MPFVGLTGGIGAGKSTALAALERLGAAVLSTDRVVHDLYQSDEMRDAVVARWGDEVAPGGSVDRTAVAGRVFASEDDRRWLEALLWPRVGERVAAWRVEMERREPPPRAAVVEIPLLFEAGMEEGFDATVAVVAPEDVRARRAAGRGHASLDARGKRQLTQEEKSQRATYTVSNDASIADLESRLSAILENLGLRHR
ncbi:MAG: dephospho-CoA kinase [Solirubrobacteraceae bacterium]